MKKVMGGWGVLGKFAVMTESASCHTCPKGQVLCVQAYVLMWKPWNGDDCRISALLKR